jgi:uncharacterized protein (DUF2062 family)
MGMMTQSLQAMKQKVSACLRQGLSPERLALTLALGFAIGCIPVVGIPTVMCAALALTLRLNLPALQAANYSMMPLQILLIVPFMRLGRLLFAFGPRPGIAAGALLHASPLAAVLEVGGMAGEAMLAWLLFAIPAVALMTFGFTMLLRRVPALAVAEAGD